MIRRDGHTHTHFCLHGSGEHAERFVQQAIQKGFNQYSFTEHSPLPEKLVKSLPNDRDYVNALAMKYGDIDNYLEMCVSLQQKYSSSIDLMIGLELDFIQGMESFTRELLDQYGHRMQDSILSVHFLIGKNGWRCVDSNPIDFKDGLIDYYGSVENVYHAYFDAVEESIDADLGPYKPKRISHLTLVEKFKRVYPLQNQDACRDKIVKLLKKIKTKNYELDVNIAGLYKPHCGDTYPTQWIIEEALTLGIPLVYGSDSHSVADVGRSYDLYEKFIGGLH
ncbi:histidinol-phosphatase HisJ [Paenibacillus sp. YSY-4.3]